MITPFYSSEEADLLLTSLRHELNYVPRPCMTFKIFGHNFLLPRDKQFYGDVYEDGSVPIYRYGADWYPPVLEWTSTLKIIRDDIAAETGQYCNQCVVNRYRSGEDHIGWHHDKVPDLVQNSSVFSVSFGGERKFQTKDQTTGETKTFITTHGSLCTIGWDLNARVKHRIAKTASNAEERISLTFRAVKSRRTKEENEAAWEKILAENK